MAMESPSIRLVSTTSTEQSGLLGHLLPLFEKETGVSVLVVAVGSGQALDIGRRGDADVLLVHDQMAEELFVREGWGLERFQVMYNDFVLLGPSTDPAKIKGVGILSGLQRIAHAKVNFISRGDRSGTYTAELRYWQTAGIPPHQRDKQWYREVGQSMGAVLNMAASLNAYTLSDRGTWLAFKNRRDLRILVEGDQLLFNQYGVILVNPQRHPHVKYKEGQRFIDWVLSKTGQTAIAGYKIEGESLFIPNARAK